MKTISVDAMHTIDHYAPHYGMDESALMENAAAALAEAAASFRRILIFCGNGNNGGDGFAAARLLSHQGKSVTVVTEAEPERMRGAAKENRLRLSETDVRVIPFAALSREERYDLIIDAILGTGFHGTVTGTFSDMISYINSAAVPVVSADIPSGVNGDTGAADPISVKADQTVTFGFAKPGLFLYPGRSLAGTVTVREIGLPQECIDATEFLTETTGFSEARALLPPLAPDIHKGDMGRVMLIAGSEGMAGAAYLCTQAAVRSGAGLVTLACPSSVKDVEMTKLDEAMVLPLPDRDGALSALGTDVLVSEVKKRDAFGMGPGLRNTADVAALVRSILPTGVSGVLDADAINALAATPKEADGKPVILTPHPAEFSRLSGLSMESIAENRLESARQFASEHSVTLVLKGASTVVAAPDGRCAINLSGNPGMATGGSGDVLTGILTAFLGCGMAPYDAARLGVYVHGFAGDLAAKTTGIRALTAGAILRHIGSSLFSLEEGIYQ